MEQIKVADVSFAYKEAPNRLILKDVNLEIESGEFVCLLGQSGCGKSTFLRLLAGLETPTSGALTIDSVPIKGASLERGVVFQDYGLFPWMSAGENILLALKQKYPQKDKKELKTIILDMFEKVGLDQTVYKKLPKELSGGMKQRCAIARSLSVDSPILLMDEPFGALDAVTRARLQDLILDLWSKEEMKKTVFFVTHDVDEALLLANRIVVLGQSPSNIIYECRIPDEKRATRDTQFENLEVLKLRNTLIKNINRDVEKHIE
ncbi:bacitracin ABC transporter ATP-binding protein [Enterococcus avium]|uniref:ABC transporter ATP-binding protein n=1 Tax=Enterococcus malodoratus TaxID=71451 RepID=UPI0008CF2CD0|nr:ABC transporter ATP-binding protein [Enterococcus malodoratus]BBM16563.1 bacitracin ABC transporter ATP-binding protein [Enterococcus avium]SET28770.1 NitT/TauT family transport system ATP-binding protein [Enterococcus malodoratus]